MPSKPFSSSTPLKTKEINSIYDEEKENYLQAAITINKTDLDVAVENAEESNKEVHYMEHPFGISREKLTAICVLTAMLNKLCDKFSIYFFLIFEC